MWLSWVFDNFKLSLEPTIITTATKMTPRTKTTIKTTTKITTSTTSTKTTFLGCDTIELNLVVVVVVGVGLLAVTGHIIFSCGQ